MTRGSHSRGFLALGCARICTRTHAHVTAHTCTCSCTYISSVTRYLVLTHYLTLDRLVALSLRPLSPSSSFETHSYSAQNEPRRGSHSPEERARFLMSVRARRILFNLNISYHELQDKLKRQSKDKSTWPRF